MLDQFISQFDTALRTLAGVTSPARPTPAEGLPEAEGTGADRLLAARLMRVNHCGEICAQALYQGQALATRTPHLAERLAGAAREEQDHLAWSAARIAELGGRTSALNPLWYGGSLALGYAAGRLGDRWNLGFLAETEQQVEKHLEGHLARLPPADVRTRAVVEGMQRDEARHARMARDMGAAELPAPVRGAMALAARVMTSVSYWV